MYFSGSLLNSLGHLLQQKPTRSSFPETGSLYVSVSSGSTSLSVWTGQRPLTVFASVFAFATSAATAPAGPGEPAAGGVAGAEAGGVLLSPLSPQATRISEPAIHPRRVPRIGGPPSSLQDAARARCGQAADRRRVLPRRQGASNRPPARVRCPTRSRLTRSRTPS